MATQNHQHLPDDSVDSQNPIDSFIEASLEKEKMHEFDLKYSVTQTQRLVPQDLGMSMPEDLPLSSSPSSSFQLPHQLITHSSSGRGGSEHNIPQHSNDLIRMPIPPPVTKEPAKASLGPKLRESDGLGVHGEQTQDLNADSSHSHNAATSSNLPVSPEIPVQLVINVPMTPSESPPHEDNKLDFTVFAVELVGALTNLAASPRAKHNQVLLYAVVVSSALAFLISSTALLLHKKRPATARMMQKAAFLIGAFGFLGIMGMLLPANMTRWFTISAFLVWLLMFIVATLIK